MGALRARGWVDGCRRWSCGAGARIRRRLCGRGIGSGHRNGTVWWSVRRQGILRGEAGSGPMCGRGGRSLAARGCGWRSRRRGWRWRGGRWGGMSRGGSGVPEAGYMRAVGGWRRVKRGAGDAAIRKIMLIFDRREFRRGVVRCRLPPPGAGRISSGRGAAGRSGRALRATERRWPESIFTYLSASVSAPTAIFTRAPSWGAWMPSWRRSTANWRPVATIWTARRCAPAISAAEPPRCCPQPPWRGF